MKFFSKWWKFHSAMLISLSLVLAGCGGSGGEGSGDSGTKGNGSNAGNNSIPDNTSTTGSGNNGSSGTVADNTNTNTDVLPVDNTGKTTIFVDTNNAIDDLSLLNAGGVPTFGKKAKGDKSLRGKAVDLNNIWAIQYSGSGEIETIYPMVKSGSKYSFQADLSETRDYKFVFLGYENERWTGDGDEVYAGPVEETTTIGASGPINELNGITDAVGAAPFLRTSSSAATKASIASVGDTTEGGITITAKKAGDKGNSITLLTRETTRATYYVGITSARPVVPIAIPRLMRYRTVEGEQGNVALKFQYHSDFIPAKSQVSTVRATGLTDAANEDFDMWEYTEYNSSSNTITIHYGPTTTLWTVAALLQTRNSNKIAFADCTFGPGFAIDAGIAAATVLNPSVATMNTNNGNLVASGNIDGVPSNFAYEAGTSTLFLNMQKTNTPVSIGAGSFYLLKATSTTAVRPTVAANANTGGFVTTLATLMQAYADADSTVRDLVDVTLVGTVTLQATSTHSTAVAVASRRLTGGADASGSTAVENFDKDTNPNFVWTDAINLFNPESLFPAGTLTLGLRNGTAISPKNPVGFDNFYKNFTYFGILHLTDTDIASGKKSKITNVEAKIVSAQSYRKEGNIGPAVTSIGNDAFTLGSPTGEIILNIRNYYHSDVSLDDLRITAGIKGANLDSDSGRVSVALPVPTLSYTIPIPVNAGVVNDAGTVLQHPVSAANTLLTFTTLAGVTVKEVFHTSTSAASSPLFAHGDVAKQNFTITKKSRREFIENFQWDDETTVSLGFVPSQAAPTDTIIYDQDQDFTTANGGRDLRSSFFSRSSAAPAANVGTYAANTGGEFIDIEYHLYYRPRSSVGTDTVTVFIEDGTIDPTGNLQGPRDPAIVSPTLAGKIAESRSPSVGLDGTIIPYNGADKDLIYNTLSLEIPIDTIVITADSVLEEPDALVGFSIQFDAVANAGSTAGQSVTDPSTMTVSADLINERAGETYTYRWNWSRFFELAGDNAFIGMPAGAVLHGTDLHQVTFSDATGLHPEFSSVKVTIRPNAGKDPEGTLRPFDPSTFDVSLTYVENVDRDFVFLDNYDSGTNALNASLLSLKAACKLDLETDATQAHLIVTPKTNSAGEIVASASEIAEAIRYYLKNSTIIANLIIANPSFKLMDVYAKGSTTDATPYWTTTRLSDVNGQVFGNARTADDNAGPSLEIKFANSADYLNVRDTGSPILTVTILDTVESHNGSTFIVDLSNAYPPVLEGSSAALTDVQYSFVSLATDGITASSKKSKTNTEQFISVSDDTDADGAITLNMRVKRTNVGTNDTDLMQSSDKVVSGRALGGPSTRENQFVAYWDVKRVSDPATQRLLAPGNPNLNDWVIAATKDFVGSGADGTANSIIWQPIYTAVYNASIVDGDTPAEARFQAISAADAAMSGATPAIVNLVEVQAAVGNTGAGVTSNTAGGTATTTARGLVVARITAAINAAVAADLTLAGGTAAPSITAVTAVGAMVATSSAVGHKSAVYNQVFTAADGVGANTPVQAHRVALAAALACENGILDVLALEDYNDTYNLVYNAINIAALADGDTVAQAKAQATIGAVAAANGANTANVNLIVTQQATGNAGAGNTSNAAGGTATTNRRATNVARIQAAITAAVNAESPALAGGSAAAGIAAVTAAGAMPAGSGALGARAGVYNGVNTAIDGVAPNTPLQGHRVAMKGLAPTGNMAEEYTNLIPTEAQKFNSAAKGNAGEHDATLATDPDDPTNTDLQHMLFSCRLILPTAASARDSYFVNFRFRPGVIPSVGLPPIMTNSFIITVTE